MITPGQTLENPVTGERFTFTHTAATTGGELLAFDLGLRSGGAVPVPHVHPIQTERFEVLEGRMRFRVGLSTLVAEPGDVVEVQPGVIHSFANAGEDEARAARPRRARAQVRPGGPRAVPQRRHAARAAGAAARRGGPAAGRAWSSSGG